MARTKRSAKLDTRNARLRLDAGKRHQDVIRRGGYLVYRRPLKGTDGTWTAQYYCRNTPARPTKILGFADDFREANGHDVITYAQAVAAASAWFDAMDREIKHFGARGGAFTVADAMAAYFDDAARRDVKGLRLQKASAGAWIIPALGGMNVSDLTQTLLEKWHTALSQSPRRVNGPMGQRVSAAPPATDVDRRKRKSTANRIYGMLRAALNFAANRQLCYAPDAPWQKVKPFRGVDAARTRYLAPAEQARLVAACTGDLKDLVTAALLTGCRFGELSRLVCGDFNKNENENGSAPTIFVAITKTGRPRHVFLTGEGAAFFGGMVAKRRGAGDYLFVTACARGPRKGKEGQWRPGAYTDGLKTACRAAGIAPVRFHELRHTYASTLINNGCPLPVIAKQLGHASTAMVERHYGHLAPTYVGDSVRAAMPEIGIHIGLPMDGNAPALG
jgi:integrase